MPDRAQLRLCLAVDLAILTVRENRLHVLVAERASEPYRGYPALPGTGRTSRPGSNALMSI